MLELSPSGDWRSSRGRRRSGRTFRVRRTGWPSSPCGDGLAGTHGDAGFFGAGDAEGGVAEDDVIGEAGHGLHFAAQQQGVLLGDEQAAVEGNLGPAAGGEQGVVERAASALASAAASMS